MIYHVSTGGGDYIINLETDDHHNELFRILRKMQLSPLVIKGLFPKPNYGQVYAVGTKIHISFRHDQPWSRESPWTTDPGHLWHERKAAERKHELLMRKHQKVKIAVRLLCALTAILGGALILALV